MFLKSVVYFLKQGYQFKRDLSSVCLQRKTKYLISKSRHCHRHCVDIGGKNMAPNLSAVRLVLYFPIVWHSAPKLLSILILAAISKIFYRT